MPNPSRVSHVTADERLGILAGLAAYGLWGLFPIYFVQLDGVAPVDVLAWRIVLCAATLAALVAWRPGAAATLARVRAVRDRGLVLAAAVTISVNWLVFIAAIDAGRILESSLGYLLVPLVNAGLGMLLFAERATRWKLASLGVAGAGIGASFAIAGAAPAYALGLALSFGLYGALKKRMDVDATTGLLLETLILVPPSLAWLALGAEPLGALEPAAGRWLMLSGVVTLVPLLAMGHAARRIELGTLGLLQYIAPTLHFALALGLYGERVDAARAVAFGAVVVAIGLWLAGGTLSRKRGSGSRATSP